MLTQQHDNRTFSSFISFAWWFQYHHCNNKSRAYIHSLDHEFENDSPSFDCNSLANKNVSHCEHVPIIIFFFLNTEKKITNYKPYCEFILQFASIRIVWWEKQKRPNHIQMRMCKKRHNWISCCETRMISYFRNALYDTTSTNITVRTVTTYNIQHDSGDLILSVVSASCIGCGKNKDINLSSNIMINIHFALPGLIRIQLGYDPTLSTRPFVGVFGQETRFGN